MLTTNTDTPKVCTHCGKKLPAVGTTRKNGKAINSMKGGGDWSSRRFHKKCWKVLYKEQEMLMNIYSTDDAKLSVALKDFKERRGLTRLL
jgi:hypothetical protein